MVTYRGHAPVVLRNTSGSVVAPESIPAESTIDPNQPSSVAPEGAGDGFTGNTGSSGTSVAGPGGSGAGNTGNVAGEGPSGGSEKFYRLSKNQSGYGLGLSIAQSIVTDHHHQKQLP